MRRYPYVVFYVEREDRIDVWRVLHTRRDIPARMHEVPRGQTGFDRIQCSHNV
jgi:hypothetical protein